MTPPGQRDQMTGLYTYKHTAELLREMVVNGDEASNLKAVGVIRANIFRLKTPHDSYGHNPIDEVIIEVGRLIQQHAQLQDIACRYGGNEYLIIVPHANLSELRERARQLQQTANQIRIFLDGQPRETIRLSVGVGICHFDSDFNWEAPALEIMQALVQATEQDFQRSRDYYLQQEQ